jgi:type VI secretion system FHA domain protein
VVLILDVISPSPSSLGGSARQTFGSAGGTIGRDGGNTWVLPHAKVSSHHAVITCAGGAFYIEDRSRNGVYLNSSRNRLTRGDPQPLTSGDRLLIEPFEIRVTIADDEAPAYGRVDPLRDPLREVDPFERLGDPAASDPFAPLQPPRRQPGADVPQPARAPAFDMPEPVPSDELDPLALLDLQEDRLKQRQAPNARDLESGLPLDAHFRPPVAVPDPRMPQPSPPAAMNDPHAIPQDYDPLAPDEPVAPPSPPPLRPSPPPPPQRPAVPPPVVERQRPYEPPPPPQPVVERPPQPVVGRSQPDEPAPEPRLRPRPGGRIEEPPAQPEIAAPPAAPAPRVAASPSVDLTAVLEGAGLNPADVTPELARAFGRIIRVVVSGVMDVLQSRRQIKDEFRMRMTQFRPAENNPLKFSANVEDALHNLLVKRNAAYLGPVESFEDAFTELRNHQLAMLAGMRVAFESMLAEFDPDRLQEDFDRQASKGLVPAKLRYWDLFRDKRREMAKDPEATFRRLFGEEFARAYEEQLQQLKKEAAAARAPKPRLPTGD